ncbi:MAG: RNA polymerase sigma factor [Micromonosporaceae bacterium]
MVAMIEREKPARTDVEDMVGRAAAGDESAWADIVRQYSGLLRSIAAMFRLVGDDAQDAAQLTWLGLVQHVRDLRSPDRMPSWLATTMRRNCLRLVRQRSHEELRDDWPEWSVADTCSQVDSRMLLAERNQRLWQAVDQLPGRQRQLVRTLFAPTAPSYDEIAAKMSIAVGTIGPARQRALRRLATLVAETGWSREDLGDLEP